MRFKLGCNLAYDAKTASGFYFNVQAMRGNGQEIVDETLTVTPEAGIETYVMPESGNRYLRFEAGPGPVSLRYEAEVILTPRRLAPEGIDETPIERLPFAVLPHLHPSRYCESDRLLRAAEQDFGNLPRGHDRVTGICNWINRQITYERGTSDVHTSALVTLIDRAGVCRDFAHLGMALCRAMGIPARFVSAYAWKLDPPDFHAVFEAYLDGRWYLFDPTRQAALDGLVRIGVGRDAAEVAFADFTGEVEPTEMKVWIEPSQPLAEAYEPTTQAISLAED